MEGASITYKSDEQIKVRIDHERCITCGACIHACHHDVRNYEDDTERFLRDLQNGVSISMFAAPAIRAGNLNYGRVLAWLRNMGVNKIYDVSLGADICTWAHIRYIQNKNPKSIITQPCPAIVNYILLYEYDLIKYLSPIHSPMLCTAIYMKEYCNVNDSIAALSPCIAKSQEFEDTGYVSYNVTLKKLYEYIETHNIQLPTVPSYFNHEESALGRLYSMPGGLKENVEFYLGKQLRIDQAEGQEIVYDALNLFSKQRESDLPAIFDVLNCPEGCNIGTGCAHDFNRFEVGAVMDRNRKHVLQDNDRVKYDELYKEYDIKLRHDDFIRCYVPKSVVRINVTDDQIEEAYASLNKFTEVKRMFDCGACGSETCYEMARRIALGYDVPNNCIQNEKDTIQSDHEKIAYINDLNKFQILMLNAVVKATKIALWNMEVVADDLVNPNNKFTWTDEFRNLLGYSNEEDFPNILNSWSDRLHPEDKERTLEIFERHMLDVTGKTPFDIEYRLLKKNNEYSFFRATGETLRDENGKALRVAGALMDITEAKNTLLVIEKKREEAESANRIKTAFLANVSHEIRTPMNSIIGFSELAQDDNTSPKTKQYLINISDNAKWLLNIINDILDSAKIESGKITLEHIPFDLQDVIAQCQSAILPKTVEKGIKLYCYAEPFTGKKLLGDPVRLRQVFMNLLSNAVKFTVAGTVKLLISIKASDDKCTVINFEVKDSGIGMSPEQISNIFEPFMQADDSITRKFGGTGLGLTITKNIIELMGGTLNAESTPGIGSRFSFDLIFDLIDDSADIPAQKLILNDIKKPTFNGELLICEDNGLNQQVICEHLARVGIKTVVAHNGKEGVDFVTERMQSGEKPFDLIFMDIHMPVMDGLEAALKISGLGVSTPIVALTANIMSNDLELYKANGMTDYLGKPFTSQELWKCLIKYLSAAEFSVVDRRRQSEEEDKSLKQLRVYFVKNNQTTFKSIIQALDAGDIKLAHRLTHTLKSNAGQIGEKRLQQIASETEIVISEGRNWLNEGQKNVLEAELKSVLERYAPLLVETDDKNRTETIDVERIREIIKQLEPMLIKNKPECMNLLDDIRTIPGAEELVRHVEEFEFKKAMDELHKLKEGLGQNNG